MSKIKHRVVSLSEVKITRNGDTANIDYSDPAMGGGMNLKVGPKLAKMTDLEVIEMHNDMILEMEELREEHPFVAIEITEGKPQIEYSKQCSQWCARGDILRCCIESSEESGHIPVIEIDGQRLSWMDFGKLVSTHEGWGMRVMFVPDDEIDKTPAIAIQESGGGHMELSRLKKLKPQGSC